jgi:hypothetical protein
MAKSLIDKVADTIIDLKDRVVGLEKQMQDYAFGTAKSATRKTKRAVGRGKRAVSRGARAAKGAVRKTKTKTRAKVRKAAGRRR